jgi:hypothetical protein
MYSGATEGILDNHTGAGKEYFQKREVKSFFDAKSGSGQPFGNQVNLISISLAWYLGRR